jgi:hypothetical protein
MDDIIRMAREAGLSNDFGNLGYPYLPELERFATLVTAAEHEAVLQAIEAVYMLEEGRNSMFSDGYKYALDQIETLIKARGQR